MESYVLCITHHALQSNFCIKSGLIFGDAVGRSPKIWMNAFVLG